MSFISDIARSLYDGGWRCEDLKDIMEEYNFTFEEAYKICSELELLEKGMKIMTKSKIQPMIIDALFESTNDIKPEMNILKVVFTGKVVKIFYKEQAKGLKTTFNRITKCLDRIGFGYLNKYYHQIRKEVGKYDWVSISDSDCNYIVCCDYDRKNNISTLYIELKGGY